MNVIRELWSNKCIGMGINKDDVEVVIHFLPQIWNHMFKKAVELEETIKSIFIYNNK